jgi:endonuclease III
MPNRSPTAQHKKSKAQLSVAKMARMLELLNATYLHHPLGDLTGGQPYRTLIGCIISLRTKDEVTIPASEKLFALADTPQAMLGLSTQTIAEAIYPAGFYKTKAQTIRDISQKLVDEFNSEVPATIDALLGFKGVGRKTANLVVGLGHGLPAICVDSHVHRMSNRFGFVQTKTPDETEMALRESLPQSHWHYINRLMVLHGREICKPIGARCDSCPIEADCLQVDVKKRKVKG